MINEEAYINSKMGRRNPFTVPEGYFDDLAGRVMEQLPDNTEQSRHAVLRTLRPLFYAAACVALFVFGVSVYFQSIGDTSQPQLSASTEAAGPENYADEAVDYAMIDNHDIYLCLMND